MKLLEKLQDFSRSKTLDETWEHVQLGVAIAGFVLLVVAVFCGGIGLDTWDRTCQLKGGALVRTARGWQCVEILKTEVPSDECRQGVQRAHPRELDLGIGHYSGSVLCCFVGRFPIPARGLRGTCQCIVRGGVG